MVLFRILLLSLFVSNLSANIIGTNVQNFNPNCDGIDFITVQSPMTLKPCYGNIGLFINHAANSLNSTLNGEGSSTEVHDHLTYADINLGFGIWKNVDFGLSFPVLLNQSIEEDTQNVLFSEKGPTEIRANLKYRFLKSKNWNSAFILTVNHNLIRNNPYAGEDAGQVINAEFSVGKRLRDYALAFNLGHRFRDPGEPISNTGIQPIQNQWIASIGFNKTLSKKNKIIAEIVSSIPTEVQRGFTKKELSSYEFIGGIKHNYSKKLALHGGFGVGIVNNTRSPDWRLYAGLNWRVGPFCKKEKKRKVVKRVEPKEPKAYIVEKVVEKVIQPKPRKFRLNNLNFRTNKSKLYPESIARLKTFLFNLKQMSPNVNKLVIEGHTDNRGSAEYNRNLSQQRAEEIKRIALKHTSLQADQIIAIGKGEDYPIADNVSQEGMAANRRVEVLLYETGAAGVPTNEMTLQGSGSASEQLSENDQGDSIPKTTTIIGNQVAHTGSNQQEGGKPQKFRLNNMNFRTGKSKLYPESMEKLKTFLLNLRKMSSSIKKLVIEGHTDSQGSAEFNQSLSQSRAEEIRRIALKHTDLSEDQIEAVGKGEGNPISDNETVEGRAANRRVEVLVFE